MSLSERYNTISGQKSFGRKRHTKHKRVDSDTVARIFYVHENAPPPKKVEKKERKGKTRQCLIPQCFNRLPPIVNGQNALFCNDCLNI